MTFRDRAGHTVRGAAFGVKSRTVLRSSAALLAEYESQQRLPVEEVLHLQQERAAAYAAYAMANSPFYREFYGAAGFTLEDLRDPAAFAALPMVEKQHVRDHFAEFSTSEATPRHTARSMTGGSTGQPLHILRDRRVSAQPLEWQLFSWWGVLPHDNIAVVARHVKTGRQRRAHALKWWPSKRIQLDAYQINEASVRGFLAEWERVRPTLLTGYAGAILEFSRLVTSLRLTPSPPRAVATTASPLNDEHRAEVQAGLGAPVYDHYRSSEIPWMGGECGERQGHHIFAPVRVVEIVDDAGMPVLSSTPGQVVATDLTNRVFPLIRYRLGDRSRVLPGLCACGVTLPRIDRVTGRQSDGLRLPDGTWVAGEGLYQIFSAVPTAVRQFQLEQRPDSSIVVRCVLGTAPDAEAQIADAIEVLRTRLQHSVAVGWEIVDEIPSEGGKIRYIRSAFV